MRPQAEESEGESRYEHDGEVFANYREFRMHRNRLSAAKSRQSKREYVERLESQVDELMKTVEALRKENWYWRSLDATTPDEVLHAAWCVCNGGGSGAGGVCNL